MYSLSDVGGATGIQNTLTSLSVPPHVIDDILRVLHDESASLQDGEPTEVRDAVFGGRSSGQTLAHHTRLAHAFLINSVIETVGTFQSTGEAVVLFRNDVHRADSDAHSATTTLLSRTQKAVDQMDDNPYTQPVAPTQGNKP